MENGQCLHGANAVSSALTVLYGPRGIDPFDLSPRSRRHLARLVELRHQDPGRVLDEAILHYLSALLRDEPVWATLPPRGPGHPIGFTPSSEEAA